MQEQILKILLSQWPFAPEKRAKEIADHMERFLDWYIWGNHPFCGWYENATDKFISDEVSDKKWTISELYSYWNEHIKSEK